MVAADHLTIGGALLQARRRDALEAGAPTVSVERALSLVARLQSAVEASVRQAAGKDTEPTAVAATVSGAASPTAAAASDREPTSSAPTTPRA